MCRPQTFEPRINISAIMPILIKSYKTMYAAKKVIVVIVLAKFFDFEAHIEYLGYAKESGILKYVTFWSIWNINQINVR